MFAFCIDWLKTGVVISEKFGNSEFGPRGDNSEFQLETTKKPCSNRFCVEIRKALEPPLKTSFSLCILKERKSV